MGQVGRIVKLCGAFSWRAGSQDLASMTGRMARSFRLDGVSTGVVELPAGAMSGVGPASAKPAGGLAELADGSRLLLAGRCWNARELAAGLGGGRPGAARVRRPGDWQAMPGSPTEAGLVAELLAAHGPEVVGRLIGEFAIVFWNQADRSVLVANDRYGWFPLYFHVRKVASGDGEETLLVGSECKAILAATGPLPYDPGGWGYFFRVGFMLGDRTLFRDVKALGPGEYLLWRAEGLTRTRYWRLSQLPVVKNDTVSVGQLNDQFDAAVGRRVEPGRLDSLLLSGGFDSRLILGSLLARNHRPRVVTVTISTRAGRREAGLVRRVTRAMNVGYEERIAPPGHTALPLGLEVFHVLDGLYPTFRLLCNRLYAVLGADTDPAWEGMALGVAIGSHHQSGSTVRANLSSLLKPRASEWPLLGKVLRRDWFEEIDTAFRQAIEEEAGRYEDSADGWIRFTIANRIRRRIATNNFQLYCRRAAPLAPGADSAFLDFALSFPARRRAGRQLYIEVYRDRYPRFMSVPVVSSDWYVNLPQAGSGPIESRSWQLNLMDGLTRLGVAPLVSQTYSRLTGSKVRAIPNILKVLRLGRLDRGIYNRPFVEKGLRKLESGSHYWLGPIQMVFYIELWHLLFIEDQYDAISRDVSSSS